MIAGVILLLFNLLVYIDYNNQRTELLQKYDDYINTAERYSMYNKSIKEQVKEDTIINGVAHIGSEHAYYCVWTKDRLSEDINNTMVHEQCHQLVWNNTQHYCGGKT